MSKGTKKRRGRIKRWAKSEAQSTATLVGAGILGGYLLGDKFWENIRESVKMGRHATKTIGEMAVGTKGERAVDALIEANQDQITEYQNEIKRFEEMARTYDEYETMGREAERLCVQLEGMILHGTAAGDSAADSVSGGLFKKIDDYIIGAVGNPKDARENMAMLERIYTDARKFYDGREKSEMTVKELSDFLREKGLDYARKKKEVITDIDNLVVQLDETYTTEDNVFDVHDKISLVKMIYNMRIEELTEEGVKNMESNIENYRVRVDENRESIEAHTGIPEYRNPSAWIDYGVNPLVAGIGLGLIVKAGSKLLPMPVERVFRYGLTWPFRAGAYAGKKAIQYTKAGSLKAYEKIKNYRSKEINSEDIEENKENGQENR